MKIVILTGAGISAESGIATFRDKGGLWVKRDPDEVASKRAMHQHPEKVIVYFNEVRKSIKGKKPNAAHIALADLEKYHDVTIVTQNIDDLHERAGSNKIIHMHGSAFEAKNVDTGKIFAVNGDIRLEEGLRPNVTLFGEYPMRESEILDSIFECDVFVAIGTSGEVYPAAGYIDRANTMGTVQTVEINKNYTAVSHKFERRIHKPATKGVVEYVKELCNGKYKANQ